MKSHNVVRLKLIAVFAALVTLQACSDASVVSNNLSKAADNFEINRRIIFYNGITDAYILTIEGRCSQEHSEAGKKFAVVCKVGDGKYKKHFLGLSDNVTYFSEQMEEAPANTYHYRIFFKPSAIIPTVDMK